MRYKILFVNEIPFVRNNDGISKVSLVLSDWFREKGMKTFFLSFHDAELDDWIEDSHYFFPQTDCSNDNVLYLSELVKKLEIDIIINQCGSAGQKKGISAILFKFQERFRTHDLSLISVIHADMFDSYRHAEYTYRKRLKKKNLSFFIPVLKCDIVKRILIKYIKFRTLTYYTKLYEYSDKVIVLCESYKNEYEEFLKKKLPNLISLPNPITIKGDESDTKQNIVLSVGRLNITHKQNDQLLNIWKCVKNKGDWRLWIVGDGPDRDYLESLVTKNKIENVFFFGRQDPQEFYAKAKIFCMTSAYEGFPLVLAEAMVNGVVPIAYDSFGSVNDIIENEKSGFIVPAFDKNKYVEIIESLISDEYLLKTISQNGLKKSQNFLLEVIGNRWLDIFNIVKK